MAIQLDTFTDSSGRQRPIRVPSGAGNPSNSDFEQGDLARARILTEGTLNPTENDNATSPDSTVRALALHQDNTSNVYYYPEELAASDNTPNSPKNAIKMTILDFTGGTLESDWEKFSTDFISDIKKNALAREIADAETAAKKLTGSSPINRSSTQPGIVNLGLAATDTISNAGASIFTAGSAANSLIEKTISAKPLEPDKQALATIWLYMPEEIKQDYNLEYKQEDLTATYKVLDVINAFMGGNSEEASRSSDVLKQAGVNIISELAKQIPFQDTLLGGKVDIQSIIRAKTKTVPVENLEYLFERVSRRKFGYTFKFFPKSPLEIRMVGAIIAAWKYYAHPTRTPESRYQNFPSVFQIEYKTWDANTNQWVANLYLNRYKIAALSNISVNYTEAGVYSTLEAQMESQGDSIFKAPTGISVTLTFDELLILNRNDMAPPSSYISNIATKRNEHH